MASTVEGVSSATRFSDKHDPAHPFDAAWPSSGFNLSLLYRLQGGMKTMQGDFRLIDITNDANPTGYRWASGTRAAQGKRSGKARATRPLQGGLEFTAKITATMRLSPT